MGMEDYTKYQQKVIKRYYENFDHISLQKLGEWVTELYLAEGKKRQKLWESAAAAMKKLGVPQSRIDHLIAQDKPELLAKVVQELQKKD